MTSIKGILALLFFLGIFIGVTIFFSWLYKKKIKNKLLSISFALVSSFIFMLIFIIPEQKAKEIGNSLFYLILFGGVLPILLWNFISKFFKFGQYGIKSVSAREDLSSYPNYKNQKAGYKWSLVPEIEKFSKGELFIDKFALYPFRGERWTSDMLSNIKTNINQKPIDFTKTVTVLGAMGSGKTEFFHSILKQNKFARSIIHDAKGDFVEKHYNAETDYIFNPYDSRGLNWDLWEEMKREEALIENFVHNLLNSATEEKDFFTSSAKKIVVEIFMRVHITYNEKTSAEKWQLLIDEIEQYGVNGANNATQSSIYSTMELFIDTFKLFGYQSTRDQPIFTINEFLNSNSRLFLLNNPALSKKITPIFSGFSAMLFEQLLSRADTKEDLTLLLFDEYLSLNFDKETRLKLLTQVRSKGGCTMLGMQYLPMHDKEHQQQLDSSSYANFIFKLNDNETVKHIVEKFDEVSYNLAKKGGNEERKEKFLSTMHIQSMPEYHHLSMYLTDKIIYLGYTPMVKNLEVINSNFERRNLKDFYEYKYKIEQESTIKECTKEEIEQIDDEYIEAEDPNKVLEKYKISEKEYHAQLKKYDLN